MLSNSLPASTVLVVMGVAGSGKSTLCAAMERLLRTDPQVQVALFEGDDFHSSANKAKMARGEALNDQDRAGWLAALSESLKQFVVEPHTRPRVGLVACSALKQRHRDVFRRLRQPDNIVLFVHLQGPPALIGARLQARQNTGEHFMPASLLPSQLAALENPESEPDVMTMPLMQQDDSPVSPDTLALAVLQGAHLWQDKNQIPERC